MIYQAYRYELDPNNAQRTRLAQHAGMARFAFNWGLAERIKRFNENEGNDKFISCFSQQKEWTKYKNERIPWAKTVTRWAVEGALRDLDRAFKNFWRGRKAGRKVGFPKFKKKGRARDSFHVFGREVKTFQDHIQLPTIGKIRVKERTRIKGRILSATISREADRWFVSFRVERDRQSPGPRNGSPIGIDLGIKCFALLSDDSEIDAPRPLAKGLKRLRRLQRSVSRKKKGSANRKKAVKKLARLYRRVRNVRQDFLHRTTTDLAKSHGVIVIEDLKVRNMVRNSKLGRHIIDMGWGEFRRQLEYKTKWYGSELLVADKFFPSSKTCSGCGNVKDELRLSERTYRCEACGLVIDRDLNAARNLVALATAKHAGSDACGEGRFRASARCPSAKQEEGRVSVSPSPSPGSCTPGRASSMGMVGSDTRR